MAGAATVSSGDRIKSLDVFRGLTVAGMILVNSSGNDFGYAWLHHAPWNGATLADFVFPSFLVILGASIAISLGRRLQQAPRRQLARQILWRSALIFAFGLLINAIVVEPHEGYRIYGVLQRIALCYAFGSLLFLVAAPSIQAAVAAVLLVGYWLLLTRFPVPGYGPGVLTPQGNLASYLDRALLAGHLFKPLTDPEGLLSTLPALTNTIFGIFAGLVIGVKRPLGEQLVRLAALGAALLAAGYAWSFTFPLNKNIWTSSYALFTSGAAISVFAALYGWIEPREVGAWWVLEVFGRNALLSYFLSGVIYGTQEFLDSPVKNMNVKEWLCSVAFGFLSPANASLAYAVTYVGFCWTLMLWFHKRRLYLKI